MDANEYNELRRGARQVAGVLTAVLDGIAEQEPDVERAMRRLPLWAMAFAAGAGAVAGWWYGPRSRPAHTPLPDQVTPQEHARALLESAGQTVRARVDEALSGGLDAITALIPEDVIEEAGNAARGWIQSALQDRLRGESQSTTESNVKPGWGTFARDLASLLTPPPADDVDVSEDDEPRGAQPQD